MRVFTELVKWAINLIFCFSVICPDGNQLLYLFLSAPRTWGLKICVNDRRERGNMGEQWTWCCQLNQIEFEICSILKLRGWKGLEMFLLHDNFSWLADSSSALCKLFRRPDGHAGRVIPCGSHLISTRYEFILLWDAWEILPFTVCQSHSQWICKTSINLWSPCSDWAQNYPPAASAYLSLSDTSTYLASEPCATWYKRKLHRIEVPFFHIFHGVRFTRILQFDTIPFYPFSITAIPDFNHAVAAPFGVDGDTTRFIS